MPRKAVSFWTLLVALGLGSALPTFAAPPAQAASPHDLLSNYYRSEVERDLQQALAQYQSAQEGLQQARAAHQRIAQDSLNRAPILSEWAQARLQRAQVKLSVSQEVAKRTALPEDQQQVSQDEAELNVAQAIVKDVQEDVLRDEQEVWLSQHEITVWESARQQARTRAEGDLEHLRLLEKGQS